MSYKLPMTQSEYIIKLNQAYQLVYSKSMQSNGNVQMRFTSPIPNQPYWTHLMNVHNMLIQWGITDYEVLLAAILHDIVEDYDVTLDQISINFSPKTSYLVGLVTKPKNYSDEQANAFYTQVSQDNEAILIKIADRIDNLLTHTVYLPSKEEITQKLIETNTYFLPMAKKVDMEKQLLIVINYSKQFC